MRAFSITLLAGTALLAAGCGSNEQATGNVANELGSNVILDQPMNDASAMESAANMTAPLVPLDNGMANMSDVADPGAGTRGTSVESNVTGM